MKQRWKSVPLGSLAEFRNGINYNKTNFGRGVKVINVKDFQDYVVPNYEDLDEINPEGVIRDESLLRDGDIIFVRSNGNRELIGRSLFVQGIHEPVAHSAFTIKARFNSAETLPRFYAYVFRSSLIRQALSAYGGGTNISNLNQDILSNLQVPLPPLEIQGRIASILSAYDDLIENNTRRIKILEQMAQAIYREWFVEFRAPGMQLRKATSDEKKVTGKDRFPAGWELKQLGDVIELAYGKALRADTRTPGPIPVYGSAGVIGDHNESLVAGPGIIVGRKGNVGSVFWSDEDFFPIDTVFYVVTELNLYYIYYNLQSQNFINNDAAVPGLSRNQAYLNPFVVPASELSNTFGEFIKPLFAQIQNLTKKNTNLRQTRDLLLPRLVGGEIEIHGP